MTKITLRTKITLTIVGLLAVTGILYGASPTFFGTVGDSASGNLPIGVAATSSKVLVTEFTTQNIDVIDDQGNVISPPFATIPNFQGNAEKYLAISPGLGMWDPDYIYVTQGANIYKFAPDGTTSATPFATLQDNQNHGCGFDGTGITFDQVGGNPNGFNYDMILTCSSGDVWRVNPSGNVSWVANAGTTQLEGPAVVPVGFGPLGGQIWAADDDAGKVYAIDYLGNVTHVVDWTGAEGVLVVPSNPCTFADSGGILFSLNQNSIYKFSQDDPAFAPVVGNILVTSETGAGIGLITTDGTNYNTSTFDNSIPGAEYEGAAFVGCQTGSSPTPTPTAIATGTPTPTTTATATATATAIATATPTPTISPTTLTVAPASGTYGGTVDLSATLTSSGSAVGGKTIAFTLNGNSVGSAITNSSGVATLTGASLSGIYPGFYPSGVGASFAGDSSYSASSATASLTVGFGTCTGSDPGGVILPPINSDGSSVYKAQGGRTIPVKFTVCDANGNPILDPNAVFPSGCCGSITVLTRMRGTVDDVNAMATTDIPDVAFHLVGNHWQFNLVTTNLDAGYTYTFQINLKFGTIQFTVAVK